MPEYGKVARLTVKVLLDESDKPQVVAPTDALQEAAIKMKDSPSHAVIVVDPTKGVVGILSPTDVATAVSEGMDLQAKVADILARKPPVITVSESTSLEEVADSIGPFATVVVTDDKNQPRAVIEREELANRIRRFFGAS
jgi:predicted transcriptional regulator